MRIKTRLQISGILSILLVILVTLFLFLTFEVVNKGIKKERMVDEIVKGVAELKIIMHEHILYPGERSLMQWQSRYDSLKKSILDNEITLPNEKTILNKILENLLRTKTIFYHLTTIMEKGHRHGGKNNSISWTLQEKLINEVLGRSQVMISAGFKLQRANHANFLAIQKRAILLVAIVLVLFTTLIIGTLFWISVSIVKPIARLEVDTQIIGGGNLDYKVGTAAKDEIGQLSRAFDEMTEDLKEKTASIYELNREIVERKRAEREINKLSEELEQRVIERTVQLEATNKELEAFSYSVSHDLRAPLRIIDGFSQALLEDYKENLDEEGKDYLNRIRAGARRMVKLIDDLLQLSRMTRQEMCYEKVDLSALAEKITRELRENEPERLVEFTITPNLTIQGDRQLLHLALKNLLNNAWKFTGKREHARIEFGVEETEGTQKYFVRDSGAGFDMAYADKLFGAFQRLHTASEFPGTGIGLATVRRVIHRHGGRVWAKSVVDEGATFYFTIYGQEI